MYGLEFSANFLGDGTWKETEHEVKLKEVKVNVSVPVSSNFSDCKVEIVEVSETLEGSVYEFELEKNE
ncbi:MAG: hypothetical protein WBN18_03620 [Flavobacteriaceae bacterium]